MSLFDFGAFIAELRDNKEEKESIEKYESFYGPIDSDITHQVWYSEYIQYFFPYYNAIKHPEELENDFDWKLLYALVLGSFSSEYELVRPNTVSENKEPVELLISVASGDKSITKNLEELWSFQICRLFEIYIKEQIDLQSLMAEGAEEYEAITKERLEKIRAIATYDEEFKSITRKMEKESAKNVLYHYTSFGTLNEILRHNSLRASDLRYLNDKNEFKIWFNVFDNVMMAMKQKDDYLSFASFLVSIKEEIDTYRNYDSYVTCFSHERDLLSQWEMYGDKCKGIAIGFDKNELIDMMFKYNKVVINGEELDFPGLLQGDVEYSFETVCKDAMRMTKDIVKAYLESGENVEDFIGQESKYHFKERCMGIFMRLQDAKDASFYAEREFRLYWNQKDQQKTVDTFPRSSRLVPFVSLTCDEKLPIKEILLGPALDDPETRIMEIKNVLKLYGYPIVNVEKSKIPYRI